MEEEKNAVERCKEIIASGTPKSFLQSNQSISSPPYFFSPDGCQLDNSYAGPQLIPVTSSDGKTTSYSITAQFLRDMLAWFKEGKSLPKRYVWEIAIHAYDLFAKEESMIEVRVEEGMTIDVIGDVHGKL